MAIRSSYSVCKGGGETVTSFLEADLDSWTCISLGIAAFFLEYALPVIRFSAGLVGDNLSSVTRSIGADSSSEAKGEVEGTGTGLVTLGGSMRN